MRNHDTDTKQSRVRIAVCIPTVREDSIQRFLKLWESEFASTPDREIRLFVHEDSPTRKVQIESPLKISWSCQSDIEEILGEDHWIIPRSSSACRSFPMLLAWRSGFDYVLTLDDDCYPEGEGEQRFIERHLRAFNRDAWFRTVDGEETRGVPYANLGSIEIALNHGLWQGVPDLDGPTTLTQCRYPRDVRLRSHTEVVPPGLCFPLCGMNVCYDRAIIPAAYNLLMGVEEYGLDRFDDIWSGVLLKKICDDFGLYITSGTPFVLHARASNMFRNLYKESLGIHANEYFWRHIFESRLDNCKTIEEEYSMLSDRVEAFPREYPELSNLTRYFQRLSEAMRRWVRLFTD